MILTNESMMDSRRDIEHKTNATIASVNFVVGNRIGISECQKYFSIYKLTVHLFHPENV